MSHTYCFVKIHAVFHKKNASPPLPIESLGDVCAMIGAILSKFRCTPIIINGVTDHVHVYFNLAPTVSLAELMRNVKTGATHYIHSWGGIFEKFAWQTGYAAFSVSLSQDASCKAYIANQHDHHINKGHKFEDEIRFFLKAYGISPDDRYMFED